MAEFAFTPLIIVGAARSGTNMLRDTLVRHPEFATWDCDEINPVWRHGHFFRDDDEFEASDLTASGCRTIRRAFRCMAKAHPDARFIVEKTCANSMRLGFVDAAVPEARYLQIVRDGVDVVASARKRWHGELEVDPRSYFLAKARNTPLLDLPLYAAQFVTSRIPKLLGRQQRLAVWGPRYRGMDADGARDLNEVCARQWAVSVDRSDAFLERQPAARWHRVYYERLVTAPCGTLREVFDFLGVAVDDAALERLSAGIRAGSIGQGHAAPGAHADRAMAEMVPALHRHGYDRSASA